MQDSHRSNSPTVALPTFTEGVPLASAVALLIVLSVPKAWAGPEGGVVVHGGATITEPAPGQTNVTQSTERAIIDWRSFSVAPHESVNFLQPSTDSVTLNRVTGGQRSIIEGALNANGHIFLLNSSGILFARDARIDVGGLLATTANIADDDFLAGRFNFSGAPAGSSVENFGRISIKDGGFAALVAPTVRNSGQIVARMGRVTLAGADTYTVDLFGDQLINFALPGGRSAASGDSSNGLIADGGRLAMPTGSVSSVLDSVVNVSAFDPAVGISFDRSGDIILRSGQVTHDGVIDVSGSTGGKVDLFAGSIQLGAASLIDASGSAGGGRVRIGGDAAGAGGPRATRVDIASGARILADATTNGNGGRVTVWGEELADFQGTISVRGGTDGGDGGFVEVSSADVIRFLGDVFLDAPKGKGGLLFLDPDDVVILPIGSSSLNASVIDANVLNRILRSGGDVVLTATNSIQVLAAVNGTGGASGGRFTLTAGSLVIEAPVITNNGAITLNATTGSVTFRGNGYLFVSNTAGTGSGSAGININAAQNVVADNAGSNGDTGQLVSLGTIQVTAQTGRIQLINALSGLQGSGVGSLQLRAATEIATRGLNSTGTINIDTGAAGRFVNAANSITAGMGVRIAAGSGGVELGAVGNGAASNAGVSTAQGNITVLTSGLLQLNSSLDAQAGAVCLGTEGCSSSATGTVARLGGVQSAAGTIVRSGAPTGSTVRVYASGNVQAGDLRAGTVVVDTQDSVAGTTGAVTLGAQTAVGTLNVLADGAVSLSGVEATGAVSVTGASVSTATNRVEAAGNVSLTATGGNINIASIGAPNANGVLPTAVRSTGGAVTLTGAATSAINVNGSVTSNGTLTVAGATPAGTGSFTTATGTVLQSATGDVRVTAGSIRVDGAVIAERNVELAGGSGGIALNSAPSASAPIINARSGSVVLTTSGAVALDGSVRADAGPICIGTSATGSTCGTTPTQRIGSMTATNRSVLQAGTNAASTSDISIYGTGDVQVANLAVGSNAAVLIDTDDNTGVTGSAVVSGSISGLPGVIPRAGSVTLRADGAASLASADVTGTIALTGSSVTVGSTILTDSVVRAGGDITLTAEAGNITVNDVGSVPGTTPAVRRAALVSTAGDVALVGRTTTNIQVNGSVLAEDGAISVSGDTTSGAASISVAAGVVLQTGTPSSPEGGSDQSIRLTAVGPVQIGGSLVAGRSSPISITTTSPMGAVTLSNAVVGFRPDGATDVLGVGDFSVSAQGAVTLNGVSSAGRIDVAGASITTGGASLRTLLPAPPSPGADPGLGGDIVLTSTGAGGITIGCVAGIAVGGNCRDATTGDRVTSYAIESGGEVRIQTTVASTISIAGNTVIESRSNMFVGDVVGAGADRNSNVLNVGSDNATLYVANRTDPEASVPPNFTFEILGGTSRAWNRTDDPVTINVRGQLLRIDEISQLTWGGEPTLVDQAPQLRTSNGGGLFLRADYPYSRIAFSTIEAGGFINGGRLVRIQYGDSIEDVRVWRWAPINITNSAGCGRPGLRSKPGVGSSSTSLAGGCGAGTFSGTSGAALAGGPSAGASSSTTGGGGSLITITGSLSPPGDGTRTTGNGLGGPAGGAGASGRSGDDSGNVASSASDQDRASDVDAEQAGSPSGSVVSRCPRGASAEADVGRTASNQGAAPDVFARCEEFTETRVSEETTASR